jgi:PPOX class probable F420-dependent enzyme
MDRTEALSRLETARVARFATVNVSGAPHIVPITFALVADEVVHMVDAKPKSTRRLARLRNIDQHSKASILVDHYDEQWATLWWVRVDGAARIVEQGPDLETAVVVLQAKYRQYRTSPPVGPAVFLTVETVRWWASAG